MSIFANWLHDCAFTCYHFIIISFIIIIIIIIIVIIVIIIIIIINDTVIARVLLLFILVLPWGEVDILSDVVEGPQADQWFEVCYTYCPIHTTR